MAYESNGDFLARVEELQGQGKSEKEIAEELKVSTIDLRMRVWRAKLERRIFQVNTARSLQEDGKTVAEIMEIMGFESESSVQTLLSDTTTDKEVFVYYLVHLADIAQNITHENFVVVQKVRSDILNSYTDGELSNAEKRTLYTASSIIMDYMRKALK